MRLRRKAEKPKAEVPGSSMADIAFLLIIFFMVSTTTSVDKTRVELPTASPEQRKEIPKDVEIISIQETGEIQGNGTPMEVFKISGFAAGILLEKPDAFFVLKIDKRVSFKQVDDVLDQLRDANARFICFPTNQDPVSGDADA